MKNMEEIVVQLLDVINGDTELGANGEALALLDAREHDEYVQEFKDLLEDVHDWIEVFVENTTQDLEDENMDEESFSTLLMNRIHVLQKRLEKMNV